MTGAEWAVCTDPDRMLTALGGRCRNRSRKSRLFAVACCLRVWHLLEDARSRKAVETSELYADGKVKKAQLVADGREALLGVRDVMWKANGESTPQVMAADAAWRAAGLHATWMASSSIRQACSTEVEPQAALLRDIFGYPSGEPPELDPLWLAWNNGAVPGMAQSIYEQRAFEQMPILGDALEEAGCTSMNILWHCRKQVLHTRGCWVLDLLLDRK